MTEQRRGHDHNYDNFAKQTPAKPCRACTDFKSWANANPKSNSSAKSIQAITKRHSCPLDKDELGTNTWSFLHTMAAYYPETPTATQQSEMTCFISMFSKFYPCDHCAADMREDLKSSPPKTCSQKDLSVWFCKLHNTVNAKLGKPLFDCSRVNERWRDGWKDGSCD